MAARELAERGFRVLLLEKGVLPRDKVCAGILTPGAKRLIEERFGGIPPECLDEPPVVRGAVLLCERGGDYMLPFGGEGLRIRRAALDAHLARRSGAEIWDGCEVLGFELGRFHVRVHLEMEGEERWVEATYLVGADGAEGLSSRLVRPEFHRLYAVPATERTMLVTTEGTASWDPEWMGLALLRRGLGLARFFCRGEEVGMAISFRGDRGWQGELEALENFLSQRISLRLSGSPARALASSNRMGSKGRFNLGAGCALLVGEAAGLLDAWGFGIRLALESGRVAAESIAESAGENVTPHLRYRYRMREILEREVSMLRRLSGVVGELDVSEIVASRSVRGKRDRRALRRRFVS